ncbi:unnamed protein product [Tilletia controversa]|nr:unnamed protein product [Tilletia controversa]
MLSAPAPYPTVSSSIPAPDDAQIVPSHRMPSICVDYLSHNWARDEDVWNSWKAMTKSKNEIANGVRLENASWRTWMKQMRNLKTVSPETLNWLKDSDVTWLYGPLHQGQIEAVPPPKVASTTERLDLVENPRHHTLKNANSASAASLPRAKLSDLRPDSSAGKKPSFTGDAPSPSLPQKPHSANNTINSKMMGNGISKAFSPPHRGPNDPSLSPPATKSILKHRTIQDLLSNPQANSAAGLGSALGFKSASQPSLPELEAAAAATSLALREGQGEAVLSPDQARALGLMGVGNSNNSNSSSTTASPATSHVGLSAITDHVVATSPPTMSASLADGAIPPPHADQQSGSSISLASTSDTDAETASILKSPTASAASLVSLASSTGSGTPNTARSSAVGLNNAAKKSAAPTRERRHISFNQRVEQCISLDMDNAPESLSYRDDEYAHDDDGVGGSGRGGMHAGDYGYGDDDDDEDGSIMWRSGPGQRVQRRPRFDDDEEEEMLTINVRSRPSSSSGGSSTSATSLSTRSHRSTHSISRRTIAKLAPTMLRGGSALPDTGEWIDHEESDAHDVDLNAGVGSDMISAGVGVGENAHVGAYAHNPVVNVDRERHGGSSLSGGGGNSATTGSGDRDAHDAPAEAFDGVRSGSNDDVDEEDERGRAPEPTRTFSYGRVHQSGRHTSPGSGPQQNHSHHAYSGGDDHHDDSYENGSDGGSGWDNNRANLPSSGQEEDEEEEDWQRENEQEGGRYIRGGVPADDVALRNRNKSRQGGGSAGRESKSKQGSSGGSRSRGDGSAGESGSESWADGDGDGDGLDGSSHQANAKSRRARAQNDAPSSPASTSSSFSSSSYKDKSSPRGPGERRRQSSTEVALEDRAVHGVLSIDVDNVPSNDPNSPVNPAHGPTPLNTPTFLLGGKPGKGASPSAKSAHKSRRGGGSRPTPSSSASAHDNKHGHRSTTSASTSAPFDDDDDEDDYDPAGAVVPHRRTSTGALVAPKNRQVQVPLAHDYVDEGDEGGLINRAVEMINTARDLIGALWGASDSDRGRSWRDSTYE